MRRSVAPVEFEYLRQIADARRDLHNLLSSNKQMTPIVLRLAFHDAATYDRKSHTGGANGSIRNELNNPPNKGIDTAVNFLEPVKERHTSITYADLYQLAGIVAVRVTGGPDIQFVHGRKDALDQRDKGSIPNPRGDAAHLRSIFVDQMGLTDKDIVVLSGAHALGRAHRDRTPGFDGPFTRDPLTFDNSYYIELLRGDTPGLVKFSTDKALLSDRVFRPLVELYARDKGAFFRDYAISHMKLSLLGNPNLHAQALRHQGQTYHHQAQSHLDQAHHDSPQYYAQAHHHYDHHKDQDQYSCAQAQLHFDHAQYSRARAQYHVTEPYHCNTQPKRGPSCYAEPDLCCDEPYEAQQCQARQMRYPLRHCY